MITLTLGWVAPRAPPRARRRSRCAAPRLDTTDDLVDVKAANSLSFSVTLLSSIRDASRREWDALAAQDESPFLEWDWLHALEASGCACAETGWRPHHLVVCYPGTARLVAAMPLYLKSHSMGDFVDDQQWVDTAHSCGASYYPKLVGAVPFTPCAGSRVLLSDSLSTGVRSQLLQLLARYLRTLAQQRDIASVHVNFCTGEEAAAFARAGFVHRIGLQYHWLNHDQPQQPREPQQQQHEQLQQPAPQHAPQPQQPPVGSADDGATEPYADFDGFLGRFRSKRRQQVRRERREVAATHETQLLRGDEVGELELRTAFAMYKRTIDERHLGRQYLNQRFFEMLAPRYRHRLCVLLVRRRSDNEVVAATLNVEKHGVLYGRYWGSVEPKHATPFLHFEACYYAPVEHAIARGWKRVEVGAGMSHFKFARGFEPRLVHSVHYMRDEGLHAAVATHLAWQREQMRLILARLEQRAPLKPLGPAGPPRATEALEAIEAAARAEPRKL